LFEIRCARTRSSDSLPYLRESSLEQQTCHGMSRNFREISENQDPSRERGNLPWKEFLPVGRGTAVKESTSAGRASILAAPYLYYSCLDKFVLLCHQLTAVMIEPAEAYVAQYTFVNRSRLKKHLVSPKFAIFLSGPHGERIALVTVFRSLIFMAPATLSYSQSLRVIGQALEVLRVKTFTVEKAGEKYIVRNWEPSFLKSITEEVWGDRHSDEILLSPGKPAESLIYTSSDTNRLEASGRSKRGSDSSQESHNLSLSLRVVGDYLDRNKALAFDISWARHSVTVKYQTLADRHKEANFTVQNLFDLGVSMYLRRSSHRLASRPTK
jgi:hypothetical protein